MNEDAAPEVAEGVENLGKGDHTVPGDDAVGFVFREELLDHPDEAAHAALESPRVVDPGNDRGEFRTHFPRFSENEEPVPDRGGFADEAHRVALAAASGGPREDVEEFFHTALTKVR
jgi:hypothetical protein